MEREPAFARVVQGTESGYANAAAYGVALQCQSDPNLDARLDVLERENDRLKRDNEFLRETHYRRDWRTDLMILFHVVLVGMTVHHP